MLSNAYFLAKFGFDTAENEPAKNLQNFAKFANFADPKLLNVCRKLSSADSASGTMVADVAVTARSALCTAFASWRSEARWATRVAAWATSQAGAPFRHGSAGMEVCHLPRTTEVNPSAHAWRISWSSNFIEPASVGDLRANIVGGGFVGRLLLDLRVLDFQRPAEGLPLRIRFQLYQVKPSVVRFSRRRKPRNPLATKCT